jgi:transcription factor WhiB
VMRRVQVTGSPAWTATATMRDTLATVWGGGTAVLGSGACPPSADPIVETWTPAPDLHGGLCADHPFPSLWDAELDGERESAAQHAQRHREAQTICRRCPIMATCLASRTGNPQLGGGVWGGEVFLEKESATGEPAPGRPVATDPVAATSNQPAPTESWRHCHPPLTGRHAQRRRTEWRRPHPGFRRPGGNNRRSGLTDGRSA